MIENNIVIKLIIGSLIVVCMFSCSKKEDDSLTLLKQPYTGSQLKIDGYFFLEYPPNSLDYLSVYFFYNNV